MRGVQMDVASEQSVEKAVHTIAAVLQSEGYVLHALVNNAGVQEGAFVDWNSMAAYENCMKVNFYGLVRVTKLCLPLLKASRGRVVNLTSIDGLRALPGNSAYSASKHAAEAFTSTLRWEMSAFGVSVHSVCPGTFKTHMASNAPSKLREIWNQSLRENREEYGNGFFNRASSLVSALMGAASSRQHKVGEAVAHAATAWFPSRRYIVGYDAILFWKPIRDCFPEFLTDSLVDLFLFLFFLGVRPSFRTPSPAQEAMSPRTLPVSSPRAVTSPRFAPSSPRARELMR